MLSSSPSLKPFEGPYYYAGYPESSQVRLTVYLKMEKLVEVLDELAPEFGHTPGNFSIRVFEGLRSIKTQTRLFENKMREIQEANPAWSEEQVEAEAAKWVSPVKNNVPPHSTGGAIDLRLYDDTIKQFFDMGPFGVIWGSNQTAPTFSADLSDAQIKNRLFLLCGTTQVGLVNYPYEWWHFSSTDRYAAYYKGLQNGTENPFAIYDKVE
jgi:D-alanyl-D-alanine dipeptidase